MPRGLMKPYPLMEKLLPPVLRASGQAPRRAQPGLSETLHPPRWETQNCSRASGSSSTGKLKGARTFVSRYPRAYARGTLDQNPKSNWSFNCPLSTFSWNST